MYIGKKYETTCLIKKVLRNDIDEQKIWSDIYPVKEHKEIVIPIINHPHNDVENGQTEYHYHVDARFENSFDLNSLRIECEKGDLIEKRKVKYVSHNIFQTDVKYISKSKLKHKCIHKGKCPHRGYDLSNERISNGIITCPLHGLKFDSDTKKIINFDS